VSAAPGRPRTLVDMGTTRRVQRLPAAPLVAAVASRGGINRLAPEGPLRRAFFRAKRSGHLTPWAADQLAVELVGAHPADLWGDDWLMSIK
jgi:hypothetical protein